MYPDAVLPICFLSDREDSQAYRVKWRKLRLMHVCRSVDVSTYQISRLIAKQTDFNWGKVQLCLGQYHRNCWNYFTRGLSHQVKWHFTLT